MRTPLTLDELLDTVEIVNAHLDSAVSPEYQAQPLAHRWARVTKVCEEAGEVWRALSKLTGENPRKGVCGTEDELLGELGDTASAAICAIQHITGDTDATWAVVSAALVKARQRVAEHAPPAECGYLSLQEGLRGARENDG
jgi:NTP pyrophosphatase (non-canonical NTP hydrolase)